VPLQPNTVQTLKEAQEAVQRSRLLSVQATKSDGCVRVHAEKKSHETPSENTVNYPAALQLCQNSMLMFQLPSNVESTIPISANIAGSPKSLKSASSSDSFKSAVDEQEPDMEMIREIEGVLHAFRTALEVLGKVIKRIDEQDKALRIEVKKLDYSLTKGLDIKQAHVSHHKKHGNAYLSALRNSQRTVRQLQLIMANLMGDLVTTLHMYSAAYEVLSPTGFQKLYSCSEKCRIRTLFELDRLAMLLFPEPLKLSLLNSDFESPLESVSLQKSGREVHVTEGTIDQRLSADYNYLLRSVQRPIASLNRIRRPSFYTADEGPYKKLTASEAAQSSNLSPKISGDEGFGLAWDSRTSTMALPQMRNVSPPTLPAPANEGRSYTDTPESPFRISPFSFGQEIEEQTAGEIFAGVTGYKSKRCSYKRARSDELLDYKPPSHSDVSSRSRTAIGEILGENNDDDSDDDGEDELIRCICGLDDYPGLPPLNCLLEVEEAQDKEDLEGFLLQCNMCKVWQHGGCVGIINEGMSPEEYFCEVCREDLHLIRTGTSPIK
jgi:hypothetical protein